MAEEAQAAPVELSSPASLFEILQAEAGDRAAAKPAPAAPEARPAPKGFVDPLDEADFSDEKLSTPEGVKAARAVIQAQVKEALRLRTTAHNARAEAERRASKFKGTKDEVLTEKAAFRAEQERYRLDVADLRSGNPEKFIPALARLSGAADPYDFWNQTAIALAKGKPVDSEQPGKIPKEVQDRLDRIEAERAAEKLAAEQAAMSQTEQQVFNLRVQQVKEATTFTDLQYVSQLAADITQVPFIDARLMAIKGEHYAQHGTALDTKAACGILEAEIRSHFELLQRAGNPSGAMNGERGAAAPVAGLARQPERQIANPEPALSSPAQNRSVSAIPASLTAAPSSANRARTAAEKKAAVEAGLSRLGVFANFGIRD